MSLTRTAVHSYKPKKMRLYNKLLKSVARKNGMAMMKHCCNPSAVGGYNPGTAQAPKLVMTKKMTEEKMLSAKIVRKLLWPLSQNPRTVMRMMLP